jgi:phosphoadenosine phosphosulfate reductase
MTKNVYQRTESQLASSALLHDSVLVAYSGGKDSIVALDLCARHFKTLVCFFMWVVPGLKLLEPMLRYPEERYNAVVLQYPHWLVSRFFKRGIYCDPRPEFEQSKEFTFSDIADIARAETGIHHVVTGMKKCDNVWRRWRLEAYAEHILHPLADWNHFHLEAYIRSHNLPTIQQSTAHTSGIDLSDREVLWLHDNHPEDYQALLALYPYAETIVYRRQWYGDRKDRLTERKRRGNQDSQNRQNPQSRGL